MNKLVVKERLIPYRILILEAILRRLPLSHQKYQLLLEELGRRKAGYEGEVSLDYYFRHLPNDKYWILHDLNLPDGEFDLQIDTLILTQNFILIIGNKHMTGKLVFDTDNEQFYQITTDKEKGYAYPMAQEERHKDFIVKLLAANHLPPAPVDYLVTLSNLFCSYVITGKNTQKVKPRVGKADVLLKKVEFFEKNYTNPLFTTKDLKKLIRLLLKLNTLPTNYLLQKYGLQKFDFITGVQCPKCQQFSLIRKKHKWFCSSCECYSKDAHIQALKDYFLLIDTRITNKQFRDFMHLKSSDIGKRLLLSANLNFMRSNRHRYYFPKTIPY